MGGQAKVVEVLLDAGADVNQSVKGWGTALQQAVEEGHTEVVKILINHGAKVDVIDDLRGQTLLELATERGFNEIAELLKEAQGKGNEPRTRIRIISARKATPEEGRRYACYDS